MYDLFISYICHKDFKNARKVLRKIKRLAFKSVVNNVSEDVEKYYNMYFRLLLVFLVLNGKDSEIDYDL